MIRESRLKGDYDTVCYVNKNYFHILSSRLCMTAPGSEIYWATSQLEKGEITKSDNWLTIIICFLCLNACVQGDNCNWGKVRLLLVNGISGWRIKESQKVFVGISFSLDKIWALHMDRSTVNERRNEFYFTELRMHTRTHARKRAHIEACRTFGFVSFTSITIRDSTSV